MYSNCVHGSFLKTAVFSYTSNDTAGGSFKTCLRRIHTIPAVRQIRKQPPELCFYYAGIALKKSKLVMHMFLIRDF